MWLRRRNRRSASVLQNRSSAAGLNQGSEFPRRREFSATGNTKIVADRFGLACYPPSPGNALKEHAVTFAAEFSEDARGRVCCVGNELKSGPGRRPVLQPPPRWGQMLSQR